MGLGEGGCMVRGSPVLSPLQDVTPYMNPAPFTVSPNTHVSQVFNLFRTMGLRHLPVVNAVGEVSPRCRLGMEPVSLQPRLLGGSL